MLHFTWFVDKWSPICLSSINFQIYSLLLFLKDIKNTCLLFFANADSRRRLRSAEKFPYYVSLSERTYRESKRPYFLSSWELLILLDTEQIFGFLVIVMLCLSLVLARSVKHNLKFFNTTSHMLNIWNWQSNKFLSFCVLLGICSIFLLTCKVINC